MGCARVYTERGRRMISIVTNDTVLGIDLNEIVALAKTTCNDSACHIRYHYTIELKSGNRIETDDELVFKQVWFQKMEMVLPKFAQKELEEELTDMELNETHEEAKNPCNCYVCGGMIFVGHKIVTWVETKMDNTRVAVHEDCYTETKGKS